MIRRIVAKRLESILSEFVINSLQYAFGGRGGIIAFPVEPQADGALRGGLTGPAVRLEMNGHALTRLLAALIIGASPPSALAQSMRSRGEHGDNLR
jgi:hypothetical protein